MHQEEGALVKAALDSNEQLLWSGKPRQGIVLRFYDIYMIPLSLLICGLAIFFVMIAFFIEEYSAGSIILMVFFGIFIISEAIYTLIIRFIIDAKERENTYYGLSDKRVIIVSGWSKREVKSFDLRTLPRISLKMEADGRGTIAFGHEDCYGWYTIAWYGIWEGYVPRFDLIENPRTVYDMVRQVQNHI